MKPFDEYMGNWCKQRNIVYTRYCDDMVFSGEFDSRMVKNKAQNFLQAMGFNLNRKKTKLLTRHKQQTVTGIVVNCKTQTPAQYRKNLRQELYYIQKYGIAAHLNKLENNNFLNTKDNQLRYLNSLLGKINFVLQASPTDMYFQNSKIAIKNKITQLNT